MAGKDSVTTFLLDQPSGSDLIKSGDILLLPDKHMYSCAPSSAYSWEFSDLCSLQGFPELTHREQTMQRTCALNPDG